MLDLFPADFRLERRTANGVTLNVRYDATPGAARPALLLLHGFPQTHAIWHGVVERLRERFTLVLPDLRGYGDSDKPAGPPDHSAYSKRTMALDVLALMRDLGHERFFVCGHDRGGRVAHRLALDHPQAVTRLALLDIVPTRTVYTQVSKNLATWYFHWFFLIQPEPLPEMLLGCQAEPFLRNFAFRGLIPDAIEEAVFAEYLRCFANPQTLHAMCEDYRAGASIDLQHDEADLATLLSCPTLILWGVHGAMHRLFDVLETWRPRAPEAQGKALPAGHWLPEECPNELAAALLEFLA